LPGDIFMKITLKQLETFIRLRIRARFGSPGQVQRFLTAHNRTNTKFRPCRDTLFTVSCRHARTGVFDLWHEHSAEMTAQRKLWCAALCPTLNKLAEPIK